MACKKKIEWEFYNTLNGYYNLIDHFNIATITSILWFWEDDEGYGHTKQYYEKAIEKNNKNLIYDFCIDNKNEFLETEEDIIKKINKECPRIYSTLDINWEGCVKLLLNFNVQINDCIKPP